MDATTQGVHTLVADWIAHYGAAGTSAAHELCDRHDPAALAFTFVGLDLTAVPMTYGELGDRSKRFATVLASHGVRQGDRVPVLLEKGPDLVVTLLAVLRLGAVYVPLFTAFAAGAVKTRVDAARARLVVTEPSQRSKLAGLDSITVLECGSELDQQVAASAPLRTSVAGGGEAPMLQLYTSGTTGAPKGVVVPVRALASFRTYMHLGLDVSSDDVFWNAADPGWAYGLYYGVVGPLVAGRPNVLVRSGFTPALTVDVIRRFGVTNFAGAPTMYRALEKSGLVRDIALRRASSAGEPLTPGVVTWAEEALGTQVRDHYGQTELGMVVNNHWHPDVARPLRAGSMGHPMPGYVLGVVDGQIALDVSGSPLLWFSGYQDDPVRTAERFTADGSWYLTADTGRVDEDGYFFFTARDDDVILAAGYRIGPFDVESVLITHPAVQDVAVVGRPDPEGVRGEVVEAFVVLVEGIEASDELAVELQQLGRVL